LNYARLREWAEAESIGIAEMCHTSSQDGENQTLENEDSKLSYKETKNTNQKDTTKQDSDRPTNKSEPFAAAELKKPFKEKKSETGSNPYSERSTASVGQKKVKSEATQSNSGEEKSSDGVDHIVNKNWKSLIPLLDSTDVPINKTIQDLLKLYPAEKVENAIAIGINMYQTRQGTLWLHFKGIGVVRI